MILVWILFLILIISILALDLGVFNKTPHDIKPKEAGIWTGIWVTFSFLFSGVIYWLYNNGYVENPENLNPAAASIKYITGYLIELSLSIDNIFIIAIIFSSFRIPKIYQHRVLFWGILGAIFFRGILIYFGVLLINRFSWTIYLFGVFLIYTAIKMLLKKETEEEYNPKKSFIYRLLKKIIPVTTHIEGHQFFIKKRHLFVATPLFIALIIIEIMDVLFALDSVPAILAITSDPFLVFSSNIFAILGLRSMYFFLANMLEKFSYLEFSLIAILGFVGLKMIFHEWIEFPEWISLTFIALSLFIGIAFSLKMNKSK